MTELRKYALLEEVAESIRIEKAQPGEQRSMKLLAETRRALTAAIYSGGVKPSWVRLRKQKPICVGKGNEQSWSLPGLRSALKACTEMVIFLTVWAGKS